MAIVTRAVCHWSDVANYLRHMTPATARGGQITRVMLLRTGGLVAIAGGLLRTAGSFAPVIVASDLARESLYIVIDVCLTVGLVSFYAQHSKRIGWSGATGLALALVGIATVRANRAIAAVDMYPAGALAIACGVIVVSTRAWVVTHDRWLGPRGVRGLDLRRHYRECRSGRECSLRLVRCDLRYCVRRPGFRDVDVTLRCLGCCQPKRRSGSY